MIYVGLSRYTKETINQLLKLNANGVILGDLFCDRKMFPYGGAELVNIMQILKNENLSVIYQTPMYATDRIFLEILQKIQYFQEEKLIDAVIVQDIGLASAVREKCMDFSIIWGRMGYARTPTVNKSTLSFYMKHGINAFECKNNEQAEYAKNIGAKAYLLYGYPKYLTINRECYYRFEHNLFGKDCELGCLKHEKMLIPVNQGIETTIDGHILGWQCVYDEKCLKNVKLYDNCIIYADTINETKKRLNEITTLE